MRKGKIKALVIVAASGLLLAGMSFGAASATVPGTNEGVDVNTTGGSPNGSSGSVSLSQNGRYAAFASSATNLVSGVSVSGTYHEIYVRDRFNSTTSLVSVSSSGTPADAASEDPIISADGRYVVFESKADNLSAAYSCGGGCDSPDHIYIHDLKTGNTSIVDSDSSGSVDANARALEPSVTADGRYVVFESSSTSLVSSPTLNSSLGYDYVYEKDMITGTVKLLSVGTGSSAPNGTSDSAWISCGGDEVAFYSYASNLVSGDTNGKSDVFLYNGIDGSIKDITQSADGDSFDKSISCNGEYVTLSSWATNLTGTSITNSYQNAYEYDRINDNFTLVSQSSSGTVGNDTSWPVGVSNDGRAVAFDSAASNLSANDTNGDYDIFLRNIEAGTTEMVDVDSSGNQANGFSSATSMSADGQYIGFISRANNLVAGFSYSTGASYTAKTGLADNY